MELGVCGALARFCRSKSCSWHADALKQRPGGNRSTSLNVYMLEAAGLYEGGPRVKPAIVTIATIAVVGLFVMGCGGKPTQVNGSQPTPPADDARVPSKPTPTPTVHRVEIGVGGSHKLSVQNFTISFDQVLEDSRCPANVVCIWAGKAVIELTVTEGDNTAVVRLSLMPGSTIESPWAKVSTSKPDSGDISIRLTGLEEYPGSDDDKEGRGPMAVLDVMIGSE